MSQQGNGNGGNVQTSGPSTITSPTSDTRTLSHRGTEVGDGNVVLENNAPGQNTPVIKFTVPQTWTEMVFAGGKHITKAQFRTTETFDGDGSQTTFSLDSDVVAVAGETEIDEQPYPAVVAYDTAAGSQLTVGSVDYMADEVTFESAPSSGSGNVKVWPVFGAGEAQYRAFDGFGHQVGPLDEWGVPMHVFADYDQEKNQTQLHMVGSGRFIEDETLSLFVSAPQEVTWEDDDFPLDEYVSKLEQRVDVSL